jgi:hypothetical protein
MNADVLFRANSVFSVWASILGNPVTYSPVVDNKIGLDVNVLFEFGNYHKTVSDYRGATSVSPAMFIFKP